MLKVYLLHISDNHPFETIMVRIYHSNRLNNSLRLDEAYLVKYSDHENWHRSVDNIIQCDEKFIIHSLKWKQIICFIINLIEKNPWINARV